MDTLHDIDREVTAEDRAYWADCNLGHHDEPPGPAYHVAYLPGLTGRPGIYGPWVVLDDEDIVHSGWMYAATAIEVLAELEGYRDV